MADRHLTAARLRELLHYDALTGVFTRLIDIGRRADQKAGKVAGTRSRGYVTIGIDGRRYFAHRLAWLWVHGIWPNGRLDHKDTVKHHNWIKNLRLATHAENMQNVIKPPSNNCSGFLGVSRNNPGPKWRASIRHNKRPSISESLKIQQMRTAPTSRPSEHCTHTTCSNPERHQ